jgi:hypothetical protein
MSILLIAVIAVIVIFAIIGYVKGLLGVLFNIFSWIFIAFFVIVILGALIAMIYIFREAPKCGMSRLWALMPLFSSFLGLIVFIVVRSSNKTTTNKITCPTCGGVHPAGTQFCSICGRKLF